MFEPGHLNEPSN